MEILSENVNRRHFGRQFTKLKSDPKEEYKEGSSEESDGKEEDDGENNPKRYYFRQRKTVVPYQAPLEMFLVFVEAFSNGPSPTAFHVLLSRNFRNTSKHFLSTDIIFGEAFVQAADFSNNVCCCFDPQVRFDAVGGLSDQISSLKEMVIFPLLYPEVFERFKIQPPRGCLFYGPPGTGKTLVARALANECSQGNRKVAFFMRKGADCLSKWAGESEKQLRMLFDQAYQMRPSIIFFDEIDGLAPVRSSRQDQVHRKNTGQSKMQPFCFQARKEILKIQTREWTPKLLDAFIDELAEECV
ncbi:hypothetical protein ASZ78_013243, partial [Callipepla squamata]